MESDFNLTVNPLVSIIIPVYNVAPYLPRCIESVLKQTYINLQIIIINDGSSDNSYKLLESYVSKDCRITLINQENAGVSVARNKGLEKVTGDYIMFLDGDDWIDTNMVDDLLQLIKQSNSDIVCSGFIFEDTALNKRRINKCRPKFVTGKYILKNYLVGKDIWSSSCARLYKKSFIKKYNFQFVPELKIGEDGYFSLQVMSKAESIVISEKCYYHALVRSTSATRVSMNEIAEDDNSLRYKEYLKSINLWEEMQEEYKAWYVRAGSSNLFHLALKTSYCNYKIFHRKYTRKSDYLKYNTCIIRCKMNLRNHLISLLSKYSFLSYYAMASIRLFKKNFLA